MGLIEFNEFNSMTAIAIKLVDGTEFKNVQFTRIHSKPEEGSQCYILIGRTKDGVYIPESAILYIKMRKLKRPKKTKKPSLWQRIKKLMGKSSKP